MNANLCDTAISDSSSDYIIQLARPCVDEPGKYIAESQYPNGFLMDMLSTILHNNVKDAKILELKCSERLGVARFELGGNTILLYRNGRIDIRRAVDVADARNIMKKIELMVKEAFTDTACD